MRHILWLEADGTIGGFHVVTYGYAPDFDPNDLTESNAQAKFIRDHHAGNAKFSSYFEYECPCPSNVGFCNCPNNAQVECHVEGNILKVKPSTSLVIDGQSVPDTTESSPLVLTAGADLLCKLSGAQVPDDTVATISRVGGADAFESFPVNLTFSGGETNEVSFLVPAKGVLTAFRIDATKWMRPKVVFVKGW